MGIDHYPDSRHSRARRVVEAYMDRTLTHAPGCPICNGTTRLVYQTELTARWRCQLDPRHEFSIAISVLAGAIGLETW